MLCSKCSEVIRPVVALDIDGTLGNFHGHFWDFMRQYLGVPIPDQTDVYRGDRPFKEWAMDWYAIDERTWYDIKLAYRQGAMKRTMPVYPSARDLSEFIIGHEAELWLTTTRPFNRLDNIDPDTREWLSRNKIVYDYLIADDDKYRILQRRVGQRVVAVLDDLPEMYDSAADAFGLSVPILRKNLYNTGVTRDFEARSLADAWTQIHKRLQLWKKASR